MLNRIFASDTAIAFLAEMPAERMTQRGAEHSLS